MLASLHAPHHPKHAQGIEHYLLNSAMVTLPLAKVLQQTRQVPG